jgi:actin-like ATPase involved in cell morphogenesis
MNLLGIDFGTTKTLAARWDARTKSPRTIRLGRSGDAIPTTIHVDKKGEFSFGDDADDFRAIDHAGWKGRIKRDLGRGTSVVLNGQSYRVADLIARFLEYVLKRVEEESFHGKVDHTVVTVPALYGPAEREELKQAIKQAGFTSFELLEEPVAAGCAFLAEKEGTELGRHVLVFDWGGGTLDLALVEHRDDQFYLEPEWISGDKNLGGEDIDDSVVDVVNAKYGETMGSIDSQPDDMRLNILRNLKEGKELLSKRAEHTFRLKYEHEQKPKPLIWKREEFEHFTAGTVDQSIECLRDHLEKIRNSGLQVEHVLLVGGSSEIPAVKRRIKEELGLKAIRWENSQTAVALGAAVRAASAGAVPGVGSAISKSNTRTALLDQYREHLRFAWVDKHISEPERHALLQKVSELGLSEDESHATEREIIGYTLKESEWLSQAKSESEIGDEAKREAGIAKNRLMGDNLREALFHSNNACDLEPTWADAFMLKGSILASLKSWTLAVVAFNRALQLNPRCAAAYTERGWCHIEAGDEDAAWNDFHYASEFGHGPAAVIGRAFVHLKKELHSEAFKDFDATLQATGYLQDMRHDSVLLHALCAWLCQKSNQSSKDAIYYANSALQLWKQGGKIEIVDQMRRWTDAEFIDDFALQLQIWLWTSCCKECKGNKREAAALFLVKDACQAPQGFWQIPEHQDFTFHAACAMANAGNISIAQTWLTRLFETNPEFDVSTLHQENAIMKHTELKSLLRPKFEHEKDWGVMFNHITITNKSPFTVHEIKVTAPVTRVVNGSKQRENVTRSLGRLKPGEAHRWDKTFQDAGWFGGNIESVTVNVSCREDAAYIDR